MPLFRSTHPGMEDFDLIQGDIVLVEDTTRLLPSFELAADASFEVPATATAEVI